VELYQVNLGQVKTTLFKDFLLIPLSKEWLSANDEKPIIFEAKLTKNGKLQLCAELSKLSQRCKEVDTNEM